ncbi:MAG: Gfo/Idh/MocA family oxidoreductase [Pirellulales bacterium]|nr:Gfo/Idh/MocA family oxidoreductase [Thermoguttaceae bacterium]MDD4786507.1 Gfo/Idh/MocA family oxidoreductase [Pirellulales bacterium]NLY99492.1 Gfo/Idh/MocA family oxidoreductase [Pirellulaceae bacterium]
MRSGRHEVSRRSFLKGSAAGVAAATIVPRHVLGMGEEAPSEQFGGALIGCGGRSRGTFQGLGPGVRLVAECDVRFKDKADGKTTYTDYRRVLERSDVDVVAIATHPGWHALISIAAMEAGKDVLCEKPMTRFIAEGRAVADAEKRFGRIFQVGTYGRFGANQKIRKIFESGLLKQCDTVLIQRGGKKVSQWSGKVAYQVADPPEWLDWNMYCGPAPLRGFHGHRFGGTHRGYWDYEGGGLADMAHHSLDGPAYQYGRDLTAPVEITPHAPPAHPEACGMWGWCELKYADGLTIVLDSGEWGKPYDRLKPRNEGEREIRAMLGPEDQEKLDAMADPAPLVRFADAIRTRRQAGGHAEASHRVATIYHLANIAFRTGRVLRFDPVQEEIVGDEEANRLVHQPMRAPWHI